MRTGTSTAALLGLILCLLLSACGGPEVASEHPDSASPEGTQGPAEEPAAEGADHIPASSMYPRPRLAAIRTLVCSPSSLRRR